MMNPTFPINKNKCTRNFTEGFQEDLLGEYSDEFQEKIMTKYLDI